MSEASSSTPLPEGETAFVTLDGVLAEARESKLAIADHTEAEKKLDEEVPYSIFRPWEKWFIVFMTSMAGIFSPLSANIYFPAIPVLATAFNEPIELINITLTVYMILQGISPILWGSLADSALCGRRPVYLSCLLLLSLSCVGLALTPTNAYWLLLILRCFQAAGCASVIALGAGTIMDIASRAERGTFLGVSALGPMVGPCIGPVAGGVLAGSLGWRSIFWFLCISSGVCFVLEFVFLPETLRAIVGDGSIPPPRLNRPIIPILGLGRKNSVQTRKSLPEHTGSHTPIDALKLLGNVDLTLILFSTAIPYSVFYSMTTSTSPIFLALYPWLSEIDLGLCFLANGAGNLVGSLTCGRLLDWDYARIRKGVRERGEIESGAKDGFHIEYARLRSSPIYWGLFVAFTIAYGWSASGGAHMAVLLVMQFFAGWALAGIFTTNQTLLMDLFPGRGASVTACNNLVRCLTGAMFVSIVDYILDAMGAGWTFTLLSGICVAAYPLVLAEWRWGKKWRLKREEKLAQQGHM